MSEHEGRVAIVTGGSSGIGAAAAIELARQGSAVVVHGGRLEGASEVARQICLAGGRSIAVAGPIEDPATSSEIVRRALQEFGRIDTLVTSAGIQTYGDAVHTDKSSWDRTLSINVGGVYNIAHYSLPEIRKSYAGSIVVVSSVQATATQRGVVAYTASKGALVAMSRALAVDEALWGVRVNCVSPGSIDTPMLRAAAADIAASSPTLTEDDLVYEWGRSHALGRVGLPHEVGVVIAFLAGPSASFVTGTEVRVDGGLLAQLPARLPEPEDPLGTH